MPKERRMHMYLVYSDESGDSGYDNSPTPAFTVSALVVSDSDWMEALDTLVDFRRWVRDEFGVPMKAEMKATHVRAGKREWAPLTRRARSAVHMQAMKLIGRRSDLFEVFAVCIRKDAIRAKSSIDPKQQAWEYLIQRVERHAANGDSTAMLVPDQGDERLVRGQLRRMRRFSRPGSRYGGKGLVRDADNLVEDPVFRNSRESYFVQFADMCAYAAFRSIFPRPHFDGAYWEALGAARCVRAAPRRYRGIVVWPS